MQQQSDNTLAAASDLFAASSKGEWYFNNESSRTAGFSSFRAAWGNRPNVDNWRRQEMVNKEIAQQSAGEETDTGNDVESEPTLITLENPDGEITYDVLLANLPLTEEKLQESNNKIADALFDKWPAISK